MKSVRTPLLLAVLAVFTTVGCMVSSLQTTTNSPTQVLASATKLPTLPEALATTAAYNSTDGFRALVSSPIVNVRAGPGGAVIGSLQSGTPVQVVECSGDWCQISKPINGFIFMGCLDIETDLGCKAK